MALTIRNKDTEAMIRELGRRWGKGPSAVVRLLAQEKLAQPGTVSDEEFQRRMNAFDELARKYPPPEPRPTWEELEAEMQSLFDYLDEEPGQR